MEATLLPFQNTYAQKQLKARLAFTLDQAKLFKAIDSDPALTGSGVVFIDKRGTSVTLRDSQYVCLFNPVRVVLREPPSQLSAIDYIAEVKIAHEKAVLFRRRLDRLFPVVRRS
jgi:hypothetical protein